MKPKVGQRWIYKDPGREFLGEVISLPPIGKWVRYVVLQVWDGYSKVGDKNDSTGLTDLYEGIINTDWTYLPGQDKDQQ